MSRGDGGPAFPISIHPDHGYGSDVSVDEGMTLRDWFAGQALPAIIALESDADLAGECHDAYLYADAMIRARSP